MLTPAFNHEVHIQIFGFQTIIRAMMTAYVFDALCLIIAINWIISENGNGVEFRCQRF